MKYTVTVKAVIHEANVYQIEAETEADAIAIVKKQTNLLGFHFAIDGLKGSTKEVRSTSVEKVTRGWQESLF